MKKNLLAIAIILISLSSFSQEYPNEGMPIRDIDGNVYRIIMTQNGVWMAENLKALKLNDGTPLNLVRDKNAWKSTKTPSFGWYNSDVKYTETYGAIYNWHAVASGKLCPQGWHVPTEEEWMDLMLYAGGNEKSGDNPAKLKEAGTTHWKAPNEGATNDIYFTALPAGTVSLFFEEDPGTKAIWWTATEDRLNLTAGEKSDNAIIVGLSSDFHSHTGGTYQKEAALSVRCKLDE
jgi:uncharacterized protein (TIGR02145 family)